MGDNAPEDLLAHSDSLRQLATRLRGFANQIAKGGRIPPEAFDALREAANWWEKFEPYQEINRIADLCEVLPPLKVKRVDGADGELTTLVKIPRDELFAYWQLQYLDNEQVSENAKKITSEKVKELSDAVDQARKTFESADKRRENLRASDDECAYPDASRQADSAWHDYREVRRELLALLSARGEDKPFDPNPEEPYVRQWQDKWRERLKERGVNFGKRGIRPNGELAKRRRGKLGLKQQDVADRIYAKTKARINVKTIGRLEGGHPVDEFTLKRVAEALNLSCRDLMADKEHAILGWPAEHRDELCAKEKR